MHQPSSTAIIQHDVGVGLLVALVEWNYAMLTIVDMGRIAACSRVTAAAVQGSTFWKDLFARAVANNGQGHCLPTYLANPSPTILHELGGYKRAVACLLSKTCLGCGMMCAQVYPLLQ